jgi:DNA-binding transcriptional MerR regulator
MKERTYTIGEVSRLSGISVRRLRFYSDEGLLPPAARTDSGYRVYSDADLVRLDLIRALRDAGIGLDAIREILSRRLSLAEALKLRLGALEAEIAAQRRVAAALRAALRFPEPTEADLRRLWTVTNLSHAERRAVIERFYDQVAQGAQMDPAWKRRMVEASTPELPDDPTPEQLDAWVELMAIVSDESFITQMRTNAEEVWNGEFDQAAYAEASTRVIAKARSAIDRGLEPASDIGGAIAREWLEGSARAMKREPDDAYMEWLRRKYREHHPRAAHYWELVAIMRGEPVKNSPGQEWQWIIAAMKHHLA